MGEVERVEMKSFGIYTLRRVGKAGEEGGAEHSARSKTVGVIRVSLDMPVR